MYTSNRYTCCSIISRFNFCNLRTFHNAKRTSSLSSAPISEQFRQTMSRITSPAMILTAGIPRSNIEPLKLPLFSLLQLPVMSQTTISHKKTSIEAADHDKSQLHGMTLGSVCSLSVFPTPLLQFNLHLPSYTSDNLHKFKYLAIHLMPPTHRSAYLSRIFAKGKKIDMRGKKWTPLGSKLVQQQQQPPPPQQQQHQKKKQRQKQVEEDKVDGEVFHEMTVPFQELDFGIDYRFQSVNISEISDTLINEDNHPAGLEDFIDIPVLNEAELIMICKCRQNLEVDQHEVWIVEVLQIVTNAKYNHSKTGGLLYFNQGFHRVGEAITENESEKHRKR
ncbi:conserved hypothetical protein [Lodderomyces elongisporus NRRL YB-4239]|uniref:Flavin reductase like domain-containing protein n=1 Tax=Lodderomyces elongisporus (strain ATCC 11503 / CBS 2605 / JCM 1781 / NBRC 1676 / NRRL YB-4239) TaxID=379508 RepID=A5DUZ0_LODEL|nr:conserved hypothetical protein [Lodderomyces elongisporus NRRL YB-4239]